MGLFLSWQRFLRRSLPIAALLLLGALSPALAEPARGRLAGTVTFPDGQPAVGVSVRVLGSSMTAVTDEKGRFDFAELPPGRYTLLAESPQLGRALASVELLPDSPSEVRLVLETALLHRDAITVTATPLPTLTSEANRPVAVLEDRALLGSLSTTLGETLNQQPGITSNYSGPGASRPIIRGLSGDLIRILDHGLGLGDVSASSPDHAVAFDPLSAERIEVVRGPAALLYGATAVGGVVNLVDEAIPDHLPDHPVTGTVTLLAGSAAEERSGSLSLFGKVGSLAWTSSFAGRDAGDVKIPGFAESDLLHKEHAPEEERMRGVLPNSFVESTTGRVGLSWVADQGFLGISALGFDSRYGIPGGGDDPVSIDLKLRRLDLRSEWTWKGPMERVKIRVGRYDYQHLELEGEQIGTRFEADGLEGRLEFLHRPMGPFRGALGFQFGNRDYVALGEEAFLPTNRTEQFALFVLEELPVGSLTLELGGRYERSVYDVLREELPDRSFSGVSGSVALRWKPRETLLTRIAISRTEVAPNPDSLYANGFHDAVQRFEFGDPSLGKETSLALDAGLRIDAEPFRLDLSVFLNRIDDFVLERILEVGDEELPAIQYAASDAEFRGFEVDSHWTLLHRHPHHLELHLSSDYVRAEERATGAALPRIPPLRYGLALEYQGERWFLTLGGKRVERPDRLAPLETDTPAYTWVDLTVGYRLPGRRSVHDLILIGRNLTDAEARVHSSFFKDFAPLPGRDLRLAYRFSF